MRHYSRRWLVVIAIAVATAVATAGITATATVASAGVSTQRGTFGAAALSTNTGNGFSGGVR